MSRILVQNLIVIASLFLIPISCEDYVNYILSSMGFNKPEPAPIQLTATPVSTEGSKPITAMEAPAAIPTTTKTVTPTTTQTFIPTTTQTVTSTVIVKPACLIPLAPPDSSGFGSFGEISFSWDSNVDAASFVVAVTAPNGTVMTFPAQSNEYSRWIESFPWGGEFTWQVLALDSDGNVLCRSATMRFTKPVTEPSQTAVPRSKPPSQMGMPHTFP